MRHSLLATSAPRAIAGAVRAETDPAVMLTRLNAAWSEFRDRHAQQQTEMQATIDDLAIRIAGQSDVGSAPVRAGRRARLSGQLATDFHAALIGRPSAAMSISSDPGGGFTVAPQVDQVIGAVLRDVSAMRTLATVVELEAGSGPYEKIIAKTGAATAWASELTERAETEAPVLAKISITPEEIYALPTVTNALLEDSSFNLNTFLEQDVATEFAVGEGAAFVNGDGINKPKGFLRYATASAEDDTRAFGTLQYVPTGASGAFAGTDPADALHNLVAALRPAYRVGDGVGWLMNSATANSVRKIKDLEGRYLWADSLSADQPNRLLGYPVAIDEAMPDIAANSLSIAFGNWQRGYAIVDKPGLRLIVDRVTKKGWSKLFFSRRVGGGVLDTNAIKLLKFSAT